MSTSKFQNALFEAVIKILTPLVRILLRNGVPYGAFAELAKRAYVIVGTEEFKLPGKQQTNTYVATITGLTRKDVLRIRKLPDIDAVESLEQYNRATRVTSAWAREKEFLDEFGLPATLPFYGDEKSFSSLVKKASGDIPARTILDELERVGTVMVSKDEDITLKSRAYIPKGDNTVNLGILGNDVKALISTIDHNMTCKKGQGLFQRKVFYDNIPDELFEELKKSTAVKAQSALEEIGSVMEKFDRDTATGIDGKGRNQIGVGIYYFDAETSAKEVLETEKEK